jgi:hypothetical protein
MQKMPQKATPGSYDILANRVIGNVRLKSLNAVDHSSDHCGSFYCHCPFHHTWSLEHSSVILRQIAAIVDYMQLERKAVQCKTVFAWFGFHCRDCLRS